MGEQKGNHISSHSKPVRAVLCGVVVYLCSVVLSGVFLTKRMSWAGEG